MARKGMGLGQGKGYKNMMGVDPMVHSQSAKGVKQPQKINPISTFTASKGRKKLNNLTEFDARHYASLGDWKVTGFEKPKIEDVKEGMIFDTGTTTKDGVKNYMQVTKIPFFNEKGDRKDIFYGIYVDPNDFSKKRVSSDDEFAVWNFDYDKNNYKLVYYNKNYKKDNSSNILDYKIFDVSTEKGLKDAEKYQSSMYKKHNSVRVEPKGVNKLAVFSDDKKTKSKQYELVTTETEFDMPYQIYAKSKKDALIEVRKKLNKGEKIISLTEV